MVCERCVQEKKARKKNGIFKVCVAVLDDAAVFVCPSVGVCVCVFFMRDFIIPVHTLNIGSCELEYTLCA